MGGAARRGVRRHLTLLVSGALVLLMGGLGLLAGHLAGQQALDVHREDRVRLQVRLGGLVQQYAQLIGVEVVDRLAASPPWSTAPGDPATSSRLEELVETARSLDVGAVLLGPTGQPIAGWSTTGLFPAVDDPGWDSLRAAVRAAEPGVLPLSGVMDVGNGHVLALAVPAALADGTRGLLVGLWDPARGALQQYVSELEHGSTGHGYVVDARGLALAAPDVDAIGEPVPRRELRSELADLEDESGLLHTDDAGGLVTSYARAGRTSWTTLTPQTRDEFEGDLVRSKRLADLAVVALLLAAGTGLVVLHRKREAALEVVALRDELTGLYNRRGWFVLAEHELERARRTASARVLLFVDLDGLKSVNDSLGHREGDRAIADAASVLRAASRASDLVGRLGGDEFVLLLGDDGQAGAARRRLLDALAAHNARSGARFELRLSVGAEVCFPDEACSLDELVHRADAEMYADKASKPERAAGLLRLPAQRDADDPTGAEVR